MEVGRYAVTAPIKPTSAYDADVSCPLCYGPMWRAATGPYGSINRVIRTEATRALVESVPEGFSVLRCDTCDVTFTQPPKGEQS